MGLIISTVFNRLFSQRPIKIMMFGLDGVGKTTILYRLKLGEIIQTFPSTCFHAETVEYKNVSLIIWDIAGGSKMRPLWKHYLRVTDGLIFVVDSSDGEGIEAINPELHKLLEEPDLKESIMLVIANKQDVPNCMTTSEITDKLNLKTLKNTKWYVHETCAIRGNSLYEGLDWLLDEIANTTK